MVHRDAHRTSAVVTRSKVMTDPTLKQADLRVHTAEPSTLSDSLNSIHEPMRCAGKGVPGEARLVGGSPDSQGREAVAPGLSPAGVQRGQ